MDKLDIDTLNNTICTMETFGKKYNNLEECILCFLWELREYRMLEEQGKLPRLPCAVGNAVYIINEYANCRERHISPCEHIVTDILLNRNRKPLFKITNRYGTARMEDFGETIFLTRKEAEAALKG